MTTRKASVTQDPLTLRLVALCSLTRSVTVAALWRRGALGWHSGHRANALVLPF